MACVNLTSLAYSNSVPANNALSLRKIGEL